MIQYYNKLLRWNEMTLSKMNNLFEQDTFQTKKSTRGTGSFTGLNLKILRLLSCRVNSAFCRSARGKFLEKPRTNRSRREQLLGPKCLKGCGTFDLWKGTPFIIAVVNHSLIPTRVRCTKIYTLRNFGITSTWKLHRFARYIRSHTCTCVNPMLYNTFIHSCEFL